MIPESVDRSRRTVEISAAPKVSRQGEALRPGDQREFSGAIVVGIIRAVDVVILVLAAILPLLLFYNAVGQTSMAWVIAGLTTIGAVNVLSFAGIYRFDLLRDSFWQSRRVLGSWTLVFLALVLCAFLMKFSDQLSRGWVTLWYVTGAVLLTLHRGVLSVLFHRWTIAGRLTQKVVVVGAGELGQRFIAHVKTSSEFGVRVVGVFDDRLTRVPDEIGGATIAGGLADLVRFCRSNPVQTVVIALPLAAEKRIVEMLDLLSPLPVDVKLLPDLAGFQLLNKPVSYLAQLPVLSANERPMKDWSAVAKRVEDLVLASLAAILIAPILLVIAAAVKFDSPGPALFRQKRYGFNHQLIEVFKFRTMHHDQADADAVRLVTRDDNRVTRLGRFLRRSSLDELPQIFNVLLGNMSLVGPRPHAVNAKAADIRYDDAVSNYAARHRVKPGITGWAQINGFRGETDTVAKIEARVEHDLYYIDHWSPLLDLWILILTVFKGFEARTPIEGLWLVGVGGMIVVDVNKGHGRRSRRGGP